MKTEPALELVALAARHLPIALFITTADGQVQWVNDAFERLSGFKIRDLAGLSITQVISQPGADPECARELKDSLLNSDPFTTTLATKRKSGEPYWAEVTLSPVRSEEGALLYYIGSQRDVTLALQAQARASEELAARQKAETLLSDIVDSIPNYLTVYDRENRLIMANAMIRSTFPQFASRLRAGMAFAEMMDAWLATEGRLPPNAPAIAGQEVAAQIESILAGVQSSEQRLTDGSWIMSSARRSTEGNLIWVSSDVTALKHAQIRSEELALRDPLTKLANRNGFFKTFEIDEQQGNSGDHADSGCLVLIDVDHFKSMNDALGHGGGDRVLEVVARRLADACSDNGVAARLGGDEFALFINEPNAVKSRIIIENLHKSCSRTMVIDGNHINTSVSIGAAFGQRSAAALNVILQHADRALYEAKRQGRNRVVFYGDELAAQFANKHAMAQRLRTAIDADRIDVRYQPVLVAKGDRVSHFEVLARWVDQDGSVSPKDFIETAEEHGLAVALGDTVIRKALMGAGQLKKVHGPQIRVAINLSNNQLLADGFVDKILGALKRSDLEPRNLELEITETVFLERSWELITQRLETLRRHGIIISLDDFGTGYASLAHLGALMIDAVKIDKRFVQNAASNRKAGLIVRSIVSLARALEIACVAEGVETQAQFDLMVELGCTHLQGYHLSKPMDLAGAEAYLGKPQLKSSKLKQIM